MLMTQRLLDKISKQFFTLTATALLSGVTFFSGPLLANPEGGVITAGNVTITQSGNQATITQSTDKGIINWQSFNIANGEVTQFNQPGAGSITLNRVVGGGGASQIFGALRANGQLMIINSAGILFGPTARVDVAGLIATTANIADQDFLSGNYRFKGDSNSNSSIINQGYIHAANGGVIALIAPAVVNNGVIAARLGKVALASGNEFTIDLTGDQLINFAVNNKVTHVGLDQSGNPLPDAVANHGKIFADGGTVLLTANVARHVVQNVINMDGIVQANTASVGRNGTIILSGGDTGKVVVSGKISATGKVAGRKGGTVKVLGEQILLTSNAAINTSGDVGGGTILIGGNFHGVGPEQNALTTAIAAGAVINASALTNGNAGKVVVWSDNYTDFQGLITARGGLLGGNGGNAEVSGGVLNYQGFTNLTAPAGLVGTLLLDPHDLTISTGSTTGITTGTNTFTSNADSSILNVGTLILALNGANVTVETGAGGGQTGNITVDTTVVGGNSLTWTGGTTLTLLANANIAINGTISNTTAGDGLVMHADSAGTGIGTITGLQAAGTGVVSFTGNNSTVTAFYNPVTFPTPDSTGAGNGIFTNVTVSGTGSTFTGFMLVNTQTQLQNINSNLSGDYALGKSLTLSGSFTPIGTGATPFTGKFNGNFNTIDNLSINLPTTDFVGLFGATSGATLENFGITNANVVGRSDIGILAGDVLNGRVSQVYSSGSISGSGSGIGGLIGSNRSTVTKSFSLGTVTSTGSGQSFIGGLAGLNNQVGGGPGTIADSFSMANVNGGTSDFVGGLTGFNNNTDTIARSYSAGAVSTSGIDAGGIVGFNNGSVGLTNLFWDTSTSGQLSAGSGVTATGLATAAMQTQGSFAGFDFVNTWGITNGVSYPYLQWLFPTGPQIISGTVFTDSTGTMPAGANNIVNLATSGTAITAFTAPTFANGTYYFALNPNTIPVSSLLLAYTSSGSAVPGTTVTVAASGNNTGVNIDGNTVLAAGSSALSNSQFGIAKGAIVDAGILYNVVGNNLTTLGTAGFQTTFSTPYNIDGNIIAAGDVQFNFLGPVTLTNDANVNSGNNTTTFSNNLVLNSGKTLTLSTPNTVTISGNISGSGNLSATQNGESLVVSGDNSGYSGTTTFDDGAALLIGVATNALGTGNLVLNGTTGNIVIAASLAATLNNPYSVNGTGGAILSGSNDITLAGPGIISAGSLLTLNTSTLTTLSGNLSGAGILQLATGTGTLLLSGNNVGFTGDTFLVAGTLEIGAATNALGSGGTFESVFLGGTLLSTISATLTNPINVAENLTIGGSNDLSLLGATTLVSGNTLTVNNTGTTILGGNLSGAGNITENTTGTLVFSGANNSGYSGTTTLTNGDLQIGAATNALGTGNLVLSVGTLSSIVPSAVLANDFSVIISPQIGGSNAITLTGAGNILTNGTILRSVNSNTTTLSGVISGAGGLEVDSGTLVVGNTSNSYSGGTGVFGGILQINGATLGTGNIQFNGGTLSTSVISTLSNPVTVTNGSTISVTNNLSLNGDVVFSNGAALLHNNIGSTIFGGVVSGDGLIIISNGQVVMKQGANSYSGGTAVSGGSLQLDAAGTPIGSGTLILNGGTILTSLDMTLGNNYTVNGPSSIFGSTNFTLSGAGTLTSGFALTNTNFGTTTLSGLITGGGALSQGGAGTMILSNTGNNYSGGTTITDGTLQINGATIGSGVLALNGGTLQISVPTTLNNSVTMGTGATATLSGTGGGNSLTFNSAINGAGNLVASVANLIFNNAVGDATPLASLLIGSALNLAGGVSTSVTTSGSQTYNGPVALNATTTIATTNSDINFNNTLNGNFDLNLTAGNGNIFFGAQVGTLALPLSTITITQAHNITETSPIKVGIFNVVSASGTVDFGPVLADVNATDGTNVLANIITGYIQGGPAILVGVNGINNVNVDVSALSVGGGNGGTLFGSVLGATAPLNGVSWTAADSVNLVAGQVGLFTLNGFNIGGSFNPPVVTPTVNNPTIIINANPFGGLLENSQSVIYGQNNNDNTNNYNMDRTPYLTTADTLLDIQGISLDVLVARGLCQ